jgi:hypothetical protein
MSFEAVWGFDPKSVLQAQPATPPFVEPGRTENCSQATSDQEEFAIPTSLSSQLYELRGMWRS